MRRIIDNIAENLSRSRLTVDPMIHFHVRGRSDHEICSVQIGGLERPLNPSQRATARPLSYLRRCCRGYNADLCSAIQQAANFLLPNTARSQDQAVASLQFEEHR